MLLISDEKLSALLKENDLLSDDAMGEAQAYARRARISLFDAILAMTLISDEDLGRLVAEELGLPFVRLGDLTIAKDILSIVPEIVARKQKVISFLRDPVGLHLAMAEPGNVEIVDFIKKKTGLPVVVHLATAADIESATKLYAEDVGKVFAKIIEENVRMAKGSPEGAADLPIITMVDALVGYAYQNRASDIHIEPQEAHSVVRFRIDGVLHDVVTLPVIVHPQIVTRIKVLSNLRTDEHQSAQDGKFRFQTTGEKLDIRVSVLPVTNGEKIVLRLLSAASRQFSLESLGFSTADLEKVRVAYTRPYGMILAAGPTGSGKTTTMYAILKIINHREVNISTIEDPVEYEMEGVNQIQVNAKTNLTFANGLRSILRQDPNVILVGEVRDEETAGIATSAAMTGHLVLSTVHANDAPSVIPRLLDMGVEPFLIASTVNVVVSQRLVRKIHSPCRMSEEIEMRKITPYINEKALAKIFGSKKGGTIRTYHGKGCAIDYGTGYEGRLGLFEVMVIDDDIREAIMARKDANAIRKIAIKNGMKTMLEDGLEKVAAGLTTIDEVIRVTNE